MMKVTIIQYWPEYFYVNLKYYLYENPFKTGIEKE